MLNKKIINKSFLIILLGFLLTNNFLNAQKKRIDFDTALNTIIEDKRDNYIGIDSLLKYFKRDSLKFKSVVEASKENDYPLLTSYALNTLGVINRNISNYDEAIKLHKEAITYADEAENAEQKVICLNMLGVAYRRMDIIKPALDYHSQALSIAYKLKETLPKDSKSNISVSIAVSQNSIGNIYMALKQYDLAIEHFKKSLEIEKGIENILGLAINYNNIGYAHEGKGNYEAALENYNKSLEYNNTMDSDMGRMICYNSIGSVYLKQQRYDLAEPIIKDALNKAIKLNDKFHLASSYVNLGQLEIGLNQLKSAEKNLKKALKVASDYKLNASIASSNKLLSQIYQDNGNFEAALNHYKASVDIENTILTEKNLQYVNDIVLEYENQYKSDQIKAEKELNETLKNRLALNKKLFWFSLFILFVIGISLLIFNRNRTLNQEKKILTLEQAMLRSQMNPHFIFNSLNSIKLYIINNEKEHAVYYLNKFSKLIRKILIASKEKETTLEDELETMKLYMNIENIRFDNEIDFNIHVEKDINIGTTKVPSLILQPFLENALWHGLSSKPNDKKINLNVSKNSEDYINVEIIDNGIGRIASKIINRNKKLNRKSVGIDITKARLANFSKAFANSYILKIDDLYESNSPTGTKVTLSIPI